MTWDLERGYDVYPRVEEEINAALDHSLAPGGPDQLYDFVAGFGLAPGSAALDLGCGEGGHTIELARCFDLVWCRDVLVHVRDLRSAYDEIGRVLKRGGRAVIYQMFATDLLEPQEAGMLARGLGFDLESGRPERTGEAITAAGLRLDRIADIGSEWGEWAQETNGGPARKLLRAARLRRSADVYIERYGQEIYDMAMADNLWHVYAMIGKLHRRAYLLAKP